MSILEEKRREAGLSRAELSKISDVPVRTIEALEQGLRKTARMELRTALALADALCFDVRLLLD